MNNSLRHILTATAAAAAISCAPDPYITVSPEESTAVSTSTLLTVTMTTNYAWTALTTDTWLKVSPSGGEAGTFNLTISVEANTQYDRRTGTVSIKSEDLVRDITVSQSQKEGLLVERELYTIGDEGGRIEVTVNANVGYTCKMQTKAAWIKEVSTKSLNRYTHIFEVEPNSDYDPREVELLFSNAGGSLTQTVTIRQLKKNALIADRSFYRVHSSGARIELNLRTNYNLYIENPSSSWIKEVETKGLKDYSYMYDILSNNEPEDRTGYLIVKDRDSEAADTVTVFQTALSGIQSDQTEARVGYGGGTLGLGFTSGSFLEEVIDCDWASPAGLTCAEDSIWTMTVKVKENRNPEERTAYIGVRDTATGLVEYVQLIQAGWPDILTITHTGFELTVPSFSGKTLTGNVDWGDGITEAYAEGLSHRYRTEGPHTVTVTIDDAATLNIANTYGIDLLDLSEF